MRSFARLNTRLGAVVATTALTVAGLSVATPSAQAAPAPDPLGLTTGTTWLSAQLTNGIVRNDQFNFDDYGLSVDIAFALQQIGGQAATVSAISDALEPGASTNYYASTFNGTTTTYAGSLAKLLVLAQLTNNAPTSYNGVNLVTALEDRTSATGPIVGRIEDANNSFGDANVLGQAYAARALAAAGSSEATNARNFLLQQQCPNGGFRLAFTADKTAAGQSCTDNAQAQVDATAVATLQLAAIGGNAGAITNAKAYLTTTQQASGAWGGGAGTSAANANSTGLAATALGDTAASVKAATWLRDRQATYYDACTKLSSAVGAIAYDDAGLATGRSAGISKTNRDEFRRATAQALPALQYLQTELGNVTPSLTGPTGYVKALSSPTFTVTGLPVGDEACLSTQGALAGGTVTSTAPYTRALKMPFAGASGATSRVITVRDRNNHLDTVTVKILGAKTLAVTKSKFRNKRSKFATVTIYGLAPGERASIFFRGQLKGRGTADSAGHFRRSVWTGRKLGKGIVTGYGQFGDVRKGSTKIKVVK